MGRFYSDPATLALGLDGASELRIEYQLALAVALIVRDGRLVEFSALRDHKQRFAVVAKTDFSAFILNAQLRK